MREAGEGLPYPREERQVGEPQVLLELHVELLGDVARRDGAWEATAHDDLYVGPPREALLLCDAGVFRGLHEGDGLAP